MRSQLMASLVIVPLSLDAASARTDLTERALQTALERLQSGIPLVERSSDGSAEISATPLRTWRSRTGHYCRAYEVRVSNTATGPKIQSGTRCRGDDGIWREVEDK